MAPPSSPPPRLAWLDALRGVAALVVAFHHGSYHYLPGLRRALLPHVNLGAWGVLVFFLVSGYIVPASLERTGSVRRFWISRVHRIHPLLVFALAVVLLVAALGGRPLAGNPRTGTGVAVDVLAHLTMVQDLLGVPNAVNVLWTLSYEMVFYLLVVALFAAGLHRRSAGVAMTLAVAAAALAAILPVAALSRGLGVRPVVVAAAVLLAAAIGLGCSARPALVRAGALLGGLLGAVLVLGNSRIDPWQGLIVLAVMFLGTAIHRADHGQGTWRGVLAAGAVVAGVAAGLGAWRQVNMIDAESDGAWPLTLVLAMAFFAAVRALRHRRMPRALTWFGVVSYSVYLLHPLLLIIADALFGRPGRDVPLYMAAFLAALLAVCAVSHRLVERPMQRLGGRVARRYAPAGRPEPDPAPVPLTSAPGRG
ncbi:acyltransferase family protein [Actinomadura macrotermitis]|uniref:Acyltransferase 3 domain-containing protein n=1 Tax=Actinomadura macrotermitis TaxID=2585200 RepID=A0A7K0C8X9_9ACTN|nr:hypothetical protein [Actinomadura macrotermitis]